MPAERDEVGRKMDYPGLTYAPINNAFVDALKVRANLKIISLRPQADAHQYDLEPSLRSNFMPVDAKFGEDYAIEALRKALF